MLMCCLPKHLATNWGQLRVLKRPEHVFGMIASVWDSTWRFSKTWTEFESLSLSEDWKSHWSKSSSLLFATADVAYMQSGFFPPPSSIKNLSHLSHLTLERNLLSFCLSIFLCCSVMVFHAGEEGLCCILCPGLWGGGLGSREETDPALPGPHHP